MLNLCQKRKYDPGYQFRENRARSLKILYSSVILTQYAINLKFLHGLNAKLTQHNLKTVPSRLLYVRLCICSCLSSFYYMFVSTLIWGYELIILMLTHLPLFLIWPYSSFCCSCNWSRKKQYCRISL